MSTQSPTRRRFLARIGIGSTAVALSPLVTAAPATLYAAPAMQSASGFTLPPLPYAYDALEPHIDTETMMLHHTRHHQAFITTLNNTLKDYPALLGQDIVSILYNITTVPEAIRMIVRNNGGGHLNHSIFWATMGPGGGGQPVGKLAADITSTFGSFDAFKAQIGGAAVARFGSGWAWLVLNKDRKLQVISTPNQDAPVMEGLAALVGVDVWEHAYYLKYRNRRADYVSAWWNTVNWDSVQKRYEQALG